MTDSGSIEGQAAGDSSELEQVLPILLEIQSRLDQDLSLEVMAAEAGQSRWHFHKCFKRAVGETLKRYTSRLRLERAAFLLLLFEDRVLDIALDCGYQSHETFTRAFKRQFGVSPIQYRQRYRAQTTDIVRRAKQILDDPERGFELSAPKVRRLAPMHLAFLRHCGPYEEVPKELYEELREWGDRHGETKLGKAPLFLGIGHDAPSVTPVDKLRYDAALRVKEPFEPQGRVGYQLLEGGSFAVTQHVGAIQTLPLAYEAMAARFETLEGYQVQGLPVIEIYATAPLTVEFEVERTDICLPVVKTK